MLAASIRVALFRGTALGLTLGAAIWTLTEAVRLPDGGWLVLLGLGATTGMFSLRLRPLGRLDTAYPMSLAALMLYGPGVSLAVALLAAFAAWVARSERQRRWVPLDLELASAGLPCCLAAAVWLGLGVIGPSSTAGVTLAGRLATHALSHGLARAALDRLARRMNRRRGAVRPAGRELLRALVVYAAGCLAALGFAWIHGRPVGRSWLLGGITLGLVWPIICARTRLDGWRRRGRQRALGLFRAIAEGLAMTLGVKGESIEAHVRRVQKLCMDLGQRLGLAEPQIEALAAAALLHDIGKLAVPERILNKPGGLTVEEMDRVKLHPQVGAGVLESIPFPYPLAPIVRHHHERWDGMGYPDRLKGEAIPLGARILAVADCFDALTSQRPYRRALSREQAIEHLGREAGRMFDPRVVGALVDHMAERARAGPPPPLEPAAEIEDRARLPSAVGRLLFAERELHALYDISRAMGHQLPLEDYLTLAACKLAAIVPYRSLVVYLLDPQSDLLRAAFAAGQAAERLRSVEIPLGQRVSGRAAQKQRCATGRDGMRPDLEDGSNDEELRGLSATLVAPLVADGETLGALTLYDHGDRIYGVDDRRILVSVAGYTAQVVRRFSGPVTDPLQSLTDPLTGIPNGRFLMLESGHRISRGAAGPSGFGLLAFQLDGLERLSELGDVDATDRLLGRVARALAADCREGETPVRFGQDVFIVLTSVDEPAQLAERWNDLLSQVEERALANEGDAVSLQLTAAHASYPGDGNTVNDLLRTLDERLSVAVERDRRVVPFRPRDQVSA